MYYCSHTQPVVGPGSRYSNFFRSGLHSTARRSSSSSGTFVGIPSDEYPPSTGVDPGESQLASLECDIDTSSSMDDHHHPPPLPKRPHQRSLSSCAIIQGLKALASSSCRLLSVKSGKRRSQCEHDSSFLSFDGPIVPASPMSHRWSVFKTPERVSLQTNALSIVLPPSPSQPTTRHSFLSFSPVPSRLPTPLPSRPSTPTTREWVNRRL